MSNGIRPAGSTPISTPASTNVETEASKTETAQQPQQSTQTNAPPPNNSNTMRGDIIMSGTDTGTPFTSCTARASRSRSKCN
jgi:hypothetical protein